MIQTYKEINKLHLLKSHADECIALFFTWLVFQWAYLLHIYLTLLFKSHIYIHCT